MSIFVKNVDWHQTESEVFLNLAIRPIKSIDDIIIADKFLKVNARPYFYELFFEQPICSEQSTCKILESNIKFRLKKSTNDPWIKLGCTAKPNENQGNDVDVKEMKKQIFDEYANSVKDDFECKKKEHVNLKRIEIDKEIERGNQIRKKIEETEATLKDQIQICKEPQGETKWIGIEPKNEKKIEREIEPANEMGIEPAIEMKTEPINENKIGTVSNLKKFEETIPLPPIRSRGTISVALSSREFVTPKRESQEHVEREWCAKQHEIMVSRIGLNDEDLNSNECDVMWLLKKGQEFLEKKNYLGAVSAFTCGLKVTKELPEVYLGRAKAQFALKNYKRCAEDCSEALEKLQPAVDSNLLIRIHCFWLRGKSLVSLGLASHGERELQMAAELDSHNFAKNEAYFLSIF